MDLPFYCCWPQPQNLFCSGSSHYKVSASQCKYSKNCLNSRVKACLILRAKLLRGNSLTFIRAMNKNTWHNSLNRPTNSSTPQNLDARDQRPLIGRSLASGWGFVFCERERVVGLLKDLCAMCFYLWCSNEVGKSPITKTSFHIHRDSISKHLLD